MERLTTHQALLQLSKATGREFVTLFRHGSLEIEVHKPHLVDRQTPHTRDELYVVISGSKYFLNGSSRTPFQPGEILFVPAGVEHRFEEFTSHFSTWVFFYGPEGEKRALPSQTAWQTLL